MTVSDYFDRGLRRKQGRPLQVRGEPVSGNVGLVASFSFEMRGGRIARASFESSTCITLVALCELLAESVEGKELAEAIRITPVDLLEKLPEIPAFKRDRALLTVAAMQHAIKTACKTSLSQ